MKTELRYAPGAGDATRRNAPGAGDPSIGNATTLRFAQVLQAVESAESAAHVASLMNLQWIFLPPIQDIPQN